MEAWIVCLEMAIGWVLLCPALIWLYRRRKLTAWDVLHPGLPVFAWVLAHGIRSEGSISNMIELLIVYAFSGVSLLVRCRLLAWRPAPAITCVVSCIAAVVLRVFMPVLPE